MGSLSGFYSDHRYFIDNRADIMDGAVTRPCAALNDLAILLLLSNPLLLKMVCQVSGVMY